MLQSRHGIMEWPFPFNPFLHIHRPHPLLKSLLSVVDSHGILRVVRLGEGAARSSVVAAYELQLSTGAGSTVLDGCPQPLTTAVDNLGAHPWGAPFIQNLRRAPKHCTNKYLQRAASHSRWPRPGVRWSTSPTTACCCHRPAQVASCLRSSRWARARPGQSSCSDLMRVRRAPGRVRMASVDLSCRVAAVQLFAGRQLAQAEPDLSGLALKLRL